MKEEKKVFGKCPKCGGEVVETKRAFSCNQLECKFVIWKTGNKYFEAIGFKVTGKSVSDFLIKGKTLAKGLKSKSGKTYNAYIITDFSGEYPQWNMKFPKKKI